MVESYNRCKREQFLREFPMIQAIGNIEQRQNLGHQTTFIRIQNPDPELQT